jgi:hypothetical protein
MMNIQAADDIAFRYSPRLFCCLLYSISLRTGKEERAAPQREGGSTSVRSQCALSCSYGTRPSARARRHTWSGKGAHEPRTKHVSRELNDFAPESNGGVLVLYRTVLFELRLNVSPQGSPIERKMRSDSGELSSLPERRDNPL